MRKAVAGVPVFLCMGVNVSGLICAVCEKTEQLSVGVVCDAAGQADFLLL